MKKIITVILAAALMVSSQVAHGAKETRVPQKQEKKSTLSRCFSGVRGALASVGRGVKNHPWLSAGFVTMLYAGMAMASSEETTVGGFSDLGKFCQWFLSEKGNFFNLPNNLDCDNPFFKQLKEVCLTHFSRSGSWQNCLERYFLLHG